MTEILTESFCERCGTRYTFESDAPRRSPLGRVRVLSKGLRNFVMTDDSSIAEAMAEARREQEFAATAHQLDAFHRTFNFCLACRQYTCGSCWNELEGRCLSCAPDPVLAAATTGAPEPEAAPTSPVAPAEPVMPIFSGLGSAAGSAEVWPEADVPAARLARVVGTVREAAETDTTLRAVAHPQPVVPVAGPVVAPVQPVPTVATEAADPSLPAAPPTLQPEPAILGLAPGQSLEDALADYEARFAAETASEAEIAAEAEPTFAGAPERVVPTFAAEPEPEPAVLPEPEPAPERVEPKPTFVAEPEPTFAGAPERVVPPADAVSQPTWPVPSRPAARPTVDPAAAPEPTAPAPWLTVAPDERPGRAPQWPSAPAWPTAQSGRDIPATLAGRPLVPVGDTTALWAASAREVLSGPSPTPVPAATAAAAPKPCVGCGLPLSANAKFCRRCGSSQH